MLELALVLPLVMGVAVAAFAVARRGAFRPLAIAAENQPAADSAARHFRRRGVLAIAAVVLFGAGLSTVLLFAIRSPGSMPVMNASHWLLLLPILTGIVGVASFAFVPRFREDEETRSAELTRRTPFTFGPRRVFAAPVAATAILIALVVWFGLISRPDGLFMYGDRGGILPGFYYGIPILIGTPIIVGVAFLAVLHIASAPRPSDGSLRAADATVRLLAIRIILNTVAAAVIMTAGIVLVMAGSTAASMAGGTIFDAAGKLTPVDSGLQAIGAWGHTGIWVGIACFIATVVFLVSAVSDATRKPFEATLVAEATP